MYSSPNEDGGADEEDLLVQLAVNKSLTLNDAGDIEEATLTVNRMPGGALKVRKMVLKREALKRGTGIAPRRNRYDVNVKAARLRALYDTEETLRVRFFVIRQGREVNTTVRVKEHWAVFPAASKAW